MLEASRLCQRRPACVRGVPPVSEASRLCQRRPACGPLGAAVSSAANGQLSQARAPGGSAPARRAAVGFCACVWSRRPFAPKTGFRRPAKRPSAYRTARGSKGGVPRLRTPRPLTPATGAGGGAARHLLAEPGSLASGSRQGVRPAPPPHHFWSRPPRRGSSIVLRPSLPVEPLRSAAGRSMSGRRSRAAVRSEIGRSPG